MENKSEFRKEFDELLEKLLIEGEQKGFPRNDVMKKLQTKIIPENYFVCECGTKVKNVQKSITRHTNSQKHYEFKVDLLADIWNKSIGY